MEINGSFFLTLAQMGVPEVSVPGSICLDRLQVNNVNTVYGCFQKWWYPTTMGFPTKNDHFRCFGGTPIFGNTHITQMTLVLIGLNFGLLFEGFFVPPETKDKQSNRFIWYMYVSVLHP